MSESVGVIEYTLSIMPELMSGLGLSFRLFFIVLAIAMPAAVIFAVLKVSAPRPVKWLLNGYTWVFRGTPLMVQLIIVYRGFVHIGITWSGWTCALVVFCLSVAAYETEIIRGGIISIDKGQYEACHVLGMNYFQTMRRVVLPQTVRRVLPTTCSEVIILFKDTSLVAGIALYDFMRAARNRVGTDFRIEAFVIAFVGYLAVSSLIVFLFGKLEKRLSASI